MRYFLCLFLISCGGESFIISKEYQDAQFQSDSKQGTSDSPIERSVIASDGGIEANRINGDSTDLDNFAIQDASTVDHTTGVNESDSRDSGRDAGNGPDGSWESSRLAGNDGGSSEQDAGRDRQAVEASGPPSCTEPSTIYAAPECNDWIRSFGDTWNGCCLTNPAFTCGVVVAGGCRYYQTPPPSQ